MLRDSSKLSTRPSAPGRGNPQHTHHHCLNTLLPHLDKEGTQSGIAHWLIALVGVDRSGKRSEKHNRTRENERETRMHRTGSKSLVVYLMASMNFTRKLRVFDTPSICTSA